MAHPEPPFSGPPIPATGPPPPPPPRLQVELGAVGWGWGWRGRVGGVLFILCSELGPRSLGKKSRSGTDELVSQAKWSNLLARFLWMRGDFFWDHAHIYVPG